MIFESFLFLVTKTAAQQNGKGQKSFALRDSKGECLRLELCGKHHKQKKDQHSILD